MFATPKLYSHVAALYRRTADQNYLSDWLRTFNWHLILHPTFSRTQSPSGASRTVIHYFSKVESLAQHPIEAFWMLERGKEYGRLHPHLLIRGTESALIDCGASHYTGCVNECIKHSWRAGRIEVDVHDPEQRGIEYITKDYDPDTTVWGLYPDVLSTAAQSAGVVQ
jgi:hypothetical protein